MGVVGVVGVAGGVDEGIGGGDGRRVVRVRWADVPGCLRR